MKTTFIVFLLALVCCIPSHAEPSQPALTVKSSDLVSVTFRLSNPTKQPFFVFPTYSAQEFYEKAEFVGQATGWISSKPVPIGEARDYIPLPPNASITFTAPRHFRQWRVTCIVVTKEIHLGPNDTRWLAEFFYPDKDDIFVRSSPQPPRELHLQ